MILHYFLETLPILQLLQWHLFIALFFVFGILKGKEAQGAFSNNSHSRWPPVAWNGGAQGGANTCRYGERQETLYA